jgi:hypothetical protein
MSLAAGDQYASAAARLIGDTDLDAYDIIPGEGRAYFRNRQTGFVSNGGRAYITSMEKAAVEWIQKYDDGFSGKGIQAGWLTPYREIRGHFRGKGPVYAEGFTDSHGKGIRSLLNLRKLKAAYAVLEDHEDAVAEAIGEDMKRMESRD